MLETIIIIVVIFAILKFIGIRSMSPKFTREDKAFKKKVDKMSDQEIDAEYSDRPDIAERLKDIKKLSGSHKN